MGEPHAFLAGVVWPANEDMREGEIWEDRMDARPKRAFRTLEAARTAVEEDMQDAIEQAEDGRPDPDPTWAKPAPTPPGLEWSLQDGTAVEEWHCDLVVPYGPDPDTTRPFGWVRRVVMEG
jgi:hypothetical protein